MEYRCSVCGESVEDDVLVYIDHAERYIMDEIRADHPEWEEKDSLCQECMDYYHEQLRGGPPEK